MLRFVSIITTICLFTALFHFYSILIKYKEIDLLNSELLSSQKSYQELCLENQKIGHFNFEKSQIDHDKMCLGSDDLFSKKWNNSWDYLHMKTSSDLYLELLEFVENYRNRCTAEGIEIQQKESFGFEELLESGAISILDSVGNRIEEFTPKWFFLDVVLDCLIQSQPQSIDGVYLNEDTFPVEGLIRDKLKESKTYFEQELICIQFRSKTKSLRDFIQSLKQTDALCFIRLLNVEIVSSKKSKNLGDSNFLSPFFVTEEKTEMGLGELPYEQVIEQRESVFIVVLQGVIPADPPFNFGGNSI